MKNVAPEDVWDHLAGFAPANDVGLHDFRETDQGGMTRVKGQDGYCPVGPGVVSGVDIRQETLRTYLNGAVVQDDLVSDIPRSEECRVGKAWGRTCRFRWWPYN